MAWGATEVLTAWETARDVTAAERVALLVAIGSPDQGASVWDLPVSQAAAILQRGFRESFGSAVDAIIECPHCAAVLEASIAIPAAEDGLEAWVDVKGWRVRMPTLGDLFELSQFEDAAEQLRQRCLEPVLGETAGPPEEELDAAVESLSGAAALHGAVRCTECRTSFEAELDAGGLLWERICADAPLLLSDIATIAGAFGWSEDAILSLTPARRTFYLSVIAGDR